MNTDDSTGIALGLISFLLFVALYVWTALALSAVFRKSGEEGWKAWVPVLNQITLLQLGRFSGWLLLLILVPIVGWLAVWALLIAACYRINLAFGHGIGMTVLAALLFPVWASILGFGAARWLGTELVGRGSAAGPRRTAGPSDDDGAYVPRVSPPAYSPSAPLSDQPAAGWTPAPVRPAPPLPPAPEFAPVAGAAEPAPDPASGRGRWGAFDLGAVSEVTSDVTGADSAAPAPISAVPRRASIPATGGIDPRVSEAVVSEPDAVPIDAVPIDAVPIDAVPIDAVPIDAVPLTPAPPVGDPPRNAPVGNPSPGAALAAPPAPPVTRVPQMPAAHPADEPWAPARSPIPAEPFPETSGQVSAVVAAPDASTPRSARASVSAQHTRPEIPDDPIDETILTRRRRTAWSLVPPSGAPVPLTSEVVLLGRKPSPDRAHPSAQLVSIDDGTVSKTHARLSLRDDRWYVTDLGSTNGVLFATFMGTEVEATPGEEIEAGERFFLGDAEVRLQRSDR